MGFTIYLVLGCPLIIKLCGMDVGRYIEIQELLTSRGCPILINGDPMQATG